jgi:hypothetical protein
LIRKPSLDGIVIGIALNDECAFIEIKDDSFQVVFDTNRPQ